MKWCFLPLGGERRARQALVKAVGLQPDDCVLDRCCGTGGTTFAMASNLPRRVLKDDGAVAVLELDAPPS